MNRGPKCLTATYATRKQRHFFQEGVCKNLVLIYSIMFCGLCIKSLVFGVSHRHDGQWLHLFQLKELFNCSVIKSPYDYCS